MKKTFTFDDVLITPKYSEIMTRSDCILTKSIKIIGSPHNPFTLATPIIAAPMDTIMGAKMAHKMAQLGGLGIFDRNYKVEDFIAYCNESKDKYVAIAFGSVNILRERVRFHNIIKLFVDGKFENKRLILCVDMAHGHSLHMRQTLHYVRNNIPDLLQSIIIIAGNVCTNNAVGDLIGWGADIVKVGIGGSSICSTRIKTGCGMPQLSAIKDCLNPIPYPIIADGGIRKPADAAKAFAMGADFIIIGSMLAGTDCTRDWNLYGYLQKSTMPFRGMASAGAKELGGADPSHVEGITTEVPMLKPDSTEKVITNLYEGVRSAMSYTNSTTLLDFYKNAEFVKVTNSTLKENDTL